MTRFVAAVSALGLLLAGCAGGSAHNSGPSVFSPAPLSTPQRSPVHVGDTLDLLRIGSGKIAVTLLRIINPATVSDYISDPAKTYVATELRLKNTGPSTISGDANRDVSVIGSDDQTYTADFATVTECTNFIRGEFLLAADQSVTGCVVFALPTGVTVAQVHYSPSSGLAHDLGVWLTS